jgi:hypothetical protein
VSDIDTVVVDSLKAPHMSRLNADHRQARFGENAVKPLRQTADIGRIEKPQRDTLQEWM